MTKDEQQHFVNELIGNVAKDIEAHIRAGDLPETWDGVELRQYIADKFDHATVYLPIARRKKYNNHILVNNL
jgi:hypothetical protein